MPQWAKGAETAEAQAKAASGTRADFLSIKPGAQPVVLRPLSDLDEIITIDVHMGVPTKKAPKNVKEDKWPGQMSAVCQNAAAFQLTDGDGSPTGEYEEGYGHCYIHEHMQEVLGKFKTSVAVPRVQSWGLFVLREAVRDGASSKITGFRDVMEDFKDKEGGKVHKIPKIVVASQSWSNFWAQFAAAAYMTDTICDRDFAVAREDNDYTIQPLPAKGPELRPGTATWQVYLDALALKGLSVEQVILDQSSPEYYGRFFDPSWKDPEEDEAADGAGDDAAAGDPVMSDEEAEKVKAKMAAAFSGGTEPT